MENCKDGGTDQPDDQRDSQSLREVIFDYFQRQSDKRKRQNKEEQAEVKAAKIAAKATVVIAIFTIALVFVGWLQYQEVQDSSDTLDRMNRIYRQQAAEMSRQANDTHNLALAAKNQADSLRNQFASSQRVIESQRATIDVTVYSVDHPITFQAHGMSFAFTLALADNGAFAANDVQMRYKLYFSKFDKRIFTEPGEQQRALCKKPMPPRIGNAPKETIYPGKAAPEQINGGWGFTDQDVIPSPNDPQHPVGLIPIVVGCVDYLSGAMPKWHQTGFIFEIRGKNFGRLLPGTDMPADSVEIDRYIFDQGDSY